MRPITQKRLFLPAMLACFVLGCEEQPSPDDAQLEPVQSKEELRSNESTIPKADQSDSTQAENCRLTFDPDTIYFEHLWQGMGSIRTTHLKHDSDSSCTIAKLDFSSGDRAQFRLTGYQFPIVLEANEILPIDVAFDPQAPGVFEATIVAQTSGSKTATLNLRASAGASIDLTDHPIPGCTTGNDIDGDGICDEDDFCPCDPFNDKDEDGWCDRVSGTDEDGNPIECPFTYRADNCPEISNYYQIDRDRDGLGDECDPCPFDKDNDSDDDGVCCGSVFNAAMGTGRSNDTCCHVSNKNQNAPEIDCPPMQSSCEELDSDNDGVNDCEDNCINQANPDQNDIDGDGYGDVCDPCPCTRGFGDFDKDGICARDEKLVPFGRTLDEAIAGGTIDLPDDFDPRQCYGIQSREGDYTQYYSNFDNCEFIKVSENPETPECNGYCVYPQVGDCVLWRIERCNPEQASLVYNPDQKDSDKDGYGDKCDCEPLNADVPVHANCGEDNCPYKANPDQADRDQDGKGDACDDCPCEMVRKEEGQIIYSDQDRDGYCAINADIVRGADESEEAFIELCSGNRHPGKIDNCPTDKNIDQLDTDGDGIGDACDPCPCNAGTAEDHYGDADNDGLCGPPDEGLNTEGVDCYNGKERDLCLTISAIVSSNSQEDADEDGISDHCGDPCVFTGKIAGNDCKTAIACINGCNFKDLEDPTTAYKCSDPCPGDPRNDQDRDGICGNGDNCPMVCNPGQENTNPEGVDDGIGDACTCPAGQDPDKDTICSIDDNCPDVYNPHQEDRDGDGRGDVCDFNIVDSCAPASNPSCSHAPVQARNDVGELLFDSNNKPLYETDNGTPSSTINDHTRYQHRIDVSCDSNNDIDHDLIPDRIALNASLNAALIQYDACKQYQPDNCPGSASFDEETNNKQYNPDQLDTDSDGKGDICDFCPLFADPNELTIAAGGGDQDGDGYCGNEDNCPEDANRDQSDIDGDGIGDVCDHKTIESCDPEQNKFCQLVEIKDENETVIQTEYHIELACDSNNDIDEDNVPDLIAVNEDLNQALAGNARCHYQADNCPGSLNAVLTQNGKTYSDFDENALERHDYLTSQYNPDQLDSDGDGKGDVCDYCPNYADARIARFVDVGLSGRDDPHYVELYDEDKDGYCGDRDNCPEIANSNQNDSDFDGRGDACDPCPCEKGTEDQNYGDLDGDSICARDENIEIPSNLNCHPNSDAPDNCPQKFNRDQSDIDHDGRGDVCDPCPCEKGDDSHPYGDLDGDGWCNKDENLNVPAGVQCKGDKEHLDNCPDIANAGQENRDGDSFGDACDPCPCEKGDANHPYGDVDEDDYCAQDGYPFSDHRAGDLTCNKGRDPDNCPDVYNPNQASEHGPGYPGDKCVGIEVCDGKDNDDDGFIDEGMPDIDGDGLCDKIDPCPCCKQEDCDADGDKVCDKITVTGDDLASCEPKDNCLDLPNPIPEGATSQPDSDNDGIGDACDVEECDGLDNDGDGKTDEIYDDDGTPSGLIDSDGDGKCDKRDPCPDDPDDDADKDGYCCGERYDETLKRGGKDNCCDKANANQEDIDGDGIGDACDYERVDSCDPATNKACSKLTSSSEGTEYRINLACDSRNDVDKDGVPELIATTFDLGERLSDYAKCNYDPDNCPDTPNPGQEDSDHDGRGDVCDPCPCEFGTEAQNYGDVDRDGWCAKTIENIPSNLVCNKGENGTPKDPDNCPTTANPGQEDTDKDGVGDACTFGDPCDGKDNDGDGQTDEDAVDTDGDGFCDEIDVCPCDSKNNTDQDFYDSAKTRPICDRDSNLSASPKCQYVPDNCPENANQDQTNTDLALDQKLYDDCIRRGETEYQCRITYMRGDACEVEVCDGVDNNGKNGIDEGMTDRDGDGKCDEIDPCPDDDDNDSDNDGYCNGTTFNSEAGKKGANDNCPGHKDDPHNNLNANPDQNDLDNDGLGDQCDPCIQSAENDSDNDGYCCGDGGANKTNTALGMKGDNDNCCEVANDQEDPDGDGKGLGCDPCPCEKKDDEDHDGLCARDANINKDEAYCKQSDCTASTANHNSCIDSCPQFPDSTNNPDKCKEEICDGKDNNDDGNIDEGMPDSDGDGVCDAIDPCPNDPDNDADGDKYCNGSDFKTELGMLGGNDNCPSDKSKDSTYNAQQKNPNQEDTDHDGRGDKCDPCPCESGTASQNYGDLDHDGLCAIDNGLNVTDGENTCKKSDCQAGTSNHNSCIDSCPQYTDATNNPAYCAEEECNGIDDNLNGRTDEGFDDTDGDGRADCVDPCPCEAGTADNGYGDNDQDGICAIDNGITKDGSFCKKKECTADSSVTNYNTCIDQCPTIQDSSNDPAKCQNEICDGIDNNHNGQTDEGMTDSDSDGLCDDIDPCPNDADNDSDGDGYCCGNTYTASKGKVGINDTCCNAYNPNQTQDIDGDGQPDACDPCPCEKGTAAQNYGDTDGDGLCARDTNISAASYNDAYCRKTGCTASSANHNSCIDNCPSYKDSTNNPAYCANEECNGIDDNLNGQTDEGFIDTDGDGIKDCVDKCPCDSNNDQDGDGKCSIDDKFITQRYPSVAYKEGAPAICRRYTPDNCPTKSNANQNDADSDGYGDVCDKCINDAANDADGDGYCCESGGYNTSLGAKGNNDNCCNDSNADQKDIDGDGKGDVCDLCPCEKNDDADHDGLCARDSNISASSYKDPYCQKKDCTASNSNHNRCVDNCPQYTDATNDPAYCAEEVCNGKDDNRNNQIDEGFPDTDGDGKADCVDTCPCDSKNDEDGDTVCSIDDKFITQRYPSVVYASNTPAICKSVKPDNCPDKPNKPQTDTDRDGLGDACDNCPNDKNTNQANYDGDKWGDVCDNCKEVKNDSQQNSDQAIDPTKGQSGFNYSGDACEEEVCDGYDNDGDGQTDEGFDADEDGVADCLDNCPNTPNAPSCYYVNGKKSRASATSGFTRVNTAVQCDYDGDGYGDACDNCPYDDNEDQQNHDHDTKGDACDNCPYDDNEDQHDTDQDGTGDACDSEECDCMDHDGNGFTDNNLGRDNDGDGYSSCCDHCDDNPRFYETDKCDICKDTVKSYMLTSKGITCSSKKDVGVEILGLCNQLCTSAKAIIELKNYGNQTIPANSLSIAIDGITADGVVHSLKSITSHSQITSMKTLPLTVNLSNTEPEPRVFREIKASVTLASDCDTTDNSHVFNEGFRCPYNDPCDEQMLGYSTSILAECNGPQTELDNGTDIPSTPIVKWRWGYCGITTSGGGTKTITEGNNTYTCIQPKHKSYDVITTPVVANMTDDNGDGKVNENDIPDVIFVSFDSTLAAADGLDFNYKGCLTVLSGDTGKELASLCDISFSKPSGTHGTTADSGFFAASGIAVGDLDGDGRPEIVTRSNANYRMNYVKLIQTVGSDGKDSFSLQGMANCWMSTSSNNTNIYSYPVIGDMDGDGYPEVLNGPVICDRTGETLITHAVAINNKQMSLGHSRNSFFVDWNPGPACKSDTDCTTAGFKCWHTDDGHPYCSDGLEIASYDGVSRYNGTTVFTTGAANTGYAAVADFDNDNRPDLVIVNQMANLVTVYKNNSDANGNIATSSKTILWQQYLTKTNGQSAPEQETPETDITKFRVSSVYSQNAKGGGPPTISDFDNDGIPDVGIATMYYYNVVNGNPDLVGAANTNTKRMLWATKSKDESSFTTGSSVFDFNGDGQGEAVFADEYTLYMADGQTGKKYYLAKNHQSPTLREYPIVVDVDNDNHAEIIVASARYAQSNNWRGITTLKSVTNDWASAGPIWNQHAYFQTNVLPNGSIPQYMSRHYYVDAECSNSNSAKFTSTPCRIQRSRNSFRQAAFKALNGTNVAPDLEPSIELACTSDVCGSVTSKDVYVHIENHGSASLTMDVQYTLAKPSGSAISAASGIWTDMELPVGQASNAETLTLPNYSGNSSTDYFVFSIRGKNGQSLIEECREGDALQNNSVILPNCPSCIAGTLVGQGTINGSTASSSNYNTNSCNGISLQSLTSKSPDAVVLFQADKTGPWKFEVTSAKTASDTKVDTVLYLRSNCGSSSSQLACNDDAPTSTGLGFRSSLTRNLTEGEVVYVIIDGKNNTTAFNFTLNAIRP